MPLRSLYRQSDERAIILVLVLWMVVILSLLAYSLLFQVGTETTITSTRKKHIKAMALARAGVGKAIVDLRNDLLFDSVEENKNFDGEGDVWARPEEGKLEVVLGKDDSDGYYTTRVIDEESLFNINGFSGTNMIVLQKIIEQIGYEEEDAKIVAAAIVDYRDGDLIPVLENPASNDEGQAYAIVKGEDEGGETDPDEVIPIRFRNEAYMTVDELLDVYGVTPDLFFGPGTPEAEHYKRVMGEPVGDRFFIKDRRRRSDEPVLGLRDYFTVWGSGALNLNTAQYHVLWALAEASGSIDGDSFAERVIRTRRGGKDSDIDNDRAFKDGADMAANGEIQAGLNASGNFYGVGIKSSTFRIISEGHVGEVTARYTVIVTRQLITMNRREDFEYMDRARERMDRNSGRTQRRENSDDERRVNYPYVRILQAYEN